MTRCGRRLVAAVLLTATMAGLPPCSIAAESVHEYLDETTAATVTVAAEPLIFSRDRTDLAVNARDYISLAPIEINRAGTRTHHWFAYVWSTIDRRSDEESMTPDDQFVLLADGRAIVLRREARSLRQLGIGQPPLPAPTRGAVAVVFDADLEVVDYVARSSELLMQVVRNDQHQDFLPWRDGRASLRAFVRFLGGD